MHCLPMQCIPTWGKMQSDWLECCGKSILFTFTFSRKKSLSHCRHDKNVDHPTLFFCFTIRRPLQFGPTQLWGPSRLRWSSPTDRITQTNDLLLKGHSAPGNKTIVSHLGNLLSFSWPYCNWYREGPQFKTWTNHDALRCMLTLSNASVDLVFWRLCLSEFRFDVLSRAGIKHKVIDASSRLATWGNCIANLSDVPLVLARMSVEKVNDEKCDREDSHTLDKAPTKLTRTCPHIRDLN